MSEKTFITVDGNEAAARIAHLCSEVIALFPISPSTPMGELCDAWSAAGKGNVWGDTPVVLQMQSEAGAAGAAHGALQAGALTTTFTASQGLLLMIPNMFKIAGELTPTVFHIAARALATHALSIFGDHSDVMSARSTGWAMLSSGGVQEAHDLALVSHAATLRARLPFMHFFDGFRTSHELNKIEALSPETVLSMLDPELVLAHRDRGLCPERPVLRGTAQNPDVFFQAREAANPWYLELPGIVQKTMDELAGKTGRQYKLFDYVGAPDAERVIVMMGSGAGAAEEAIAKQNDAGEKVGLVKVRLFRPFSNVDLLAAVPKTAKKIGVLDRCKEPGSAGEPLYQDILTAFAEAHAEGTIDAMPRIVGGRYGLSSKEFTPAMTAGIYAELGRDAPKNHFTMGIVDDVTHTSIEYDKSFTTESDKVVRAVFYGLGSDGTVGASKSSVKIINGTTDLYAQGYFVYDSRKAGAVTVSHLRFGPETINSSYLIGEASFVACHAFGFTQRMDVLGEAAKGATFLLNTPFAADEVWDELPQEMQQQIIEKELKVYCINAYAIARQVGLGHRINMVMQTCFFSLAGVIPKDQAITAIKGMIKKTYGKLGEKIVNKNINAVDEALANLHAVKIPGKSTSEKRRIPPVPDHAEDFVKRVTGMIIDGKGDMLPVSALPPDGTFPVATTRYERRGIAQQVPIWDSSLCIQCSKCSIACPHAAIRAKIFDPEKLGADAGNGRPETFETLSWKGNDFKGMEMRIQVAPDDCTGCGICVDVCPARSKEEVKHKAINMSPRLDHLDVERANWDYFIDQPDLDRRLIKPGQVRTAQMFEPMFEFSSACAGCGETPYLKLVTQLFGDRMVVANATGCSSIYGGNLPTTPWSKGQHGRGPAWANSLFEDNAEFGLGMRLALDQQESQARRLLGKMAPKVGEALAKAILECKQLDEADIYEQRQRVTELRKRLEGDESDDAKALKVVAEDLVRQSVWIIGGDGWAYDIGFGGLDHALASGRDVNILVLDTEVYSNTGGQSSKSTPRSAIAKFAAKGKRTGKKDMGMIAMSYGNVYVGQVAMGGNDTHTLKTLIEAESWRGPSLILAYSHCVAHGIDMGKGMQHQKEAVDTAYWPLYRYDPRLAAAGNAPFRLDSKRRTPSVHDYLLKEARFAMLARSRPDDAEELFGALQQDIDARWHLYEQMSALAPIEQTEAEESD